jgi:hypothetical protein
MTNRSAASGAGVVDAAGVRRPTKSLPSQHVDAEIETVGQLPFDGYSGWVSLRRPGVGIQPR